MKTKQNKQTNEQQKNKKKTQKKAKTNKQDYWGFFNQTEIS